MQQSTKKLLILSGTGIITFMLDQLSKMWVQANMQVGETIPLIKGFFNITYVINNGIVFGFFTKNPIVFWIVSISGIGVIVYLFTYVYQNMSTFNFVTLISYGLIAGGAFGNSYDRFFRGYVIDFIDFAGIWGFIFNLADLFINVALILLFIDSYIGKES